jgi:BTB/POZ domain
MVPQLISSVSSVMVNASNNISVGVRTPDRVVLLVDDTRFIVEVDALRAYPNTMLGRFVFV